MLVYCPHDGNKLHVAADPVVGFPGQVEFCDWIIAPMATQHNYMVGILICYSKGAEDEELFS